MNLWVQIPRYLLVGSIVFAFDTGLFLLFFNLGMPALIANTLSMTIAFIVGLAGHHYFTFNQQAALGWPLVMRYTCTLLFNLGLGSVVLHLMLKSGYSALLAKLLAIVVVTCSSFMISRYWVFKLFKDGSTHE